MVSQLNRSADNRLAATVIADIDDEMLDGIFEISNEGSPRYLFVDSDMVHEQSSLAQIRDLANRQEADLLSEALDELRSESASRSPNVAQAVKSARRLLASGKFDGIADLLRQIRQRYPLSSAEARALDEVLAEAYVLIAENQNCVCDRNAESCLFPLRGGGIHREAEPARKAQRLYRSLSERFPETSRYRWLADLTAMFIEGNGFVAGRPRSSEFVDVAKDVGLHNAEHPRSAGGTLIDDFNGDGHFDVMLGAYLQNDSLLYYEGNADGSFSDRTVEAGLDQQFGSFRLNQADFDNDGDLDVFIARGAWVAPGRNSLLRNDGNGRFTDITALAGLDTIQQSMAGAWADFDGDGLVDLFVANLGLGDSSVLYRNLGDGTFQDVTRATDLPRLRMCSGATWGDYDNDGDADLYVSIAVGPNFLFRNNADGTFSDVTAESGVGRPMVSFPTWFFDYDNDGQLDLFGGTFCMVPEREFANLTGRRNPDEASRLRLHRNSGEGRFHDVSSAVGLNTVASTMGGNFGDVDSDGYLDFYLGTGSPDLTHIVPNRFFSNRNGESFVDRTEELRVGHLQKGHGIAFADFDRDGDQDIFTNLGGGFPVDRFQPALFSNPGNGNGWLEVKLEGTRSNRAAIGARLEVRLGDGRSVHRHVMSGGPFGASPLVQHFGLGKQDRVELLIVRWPSGVVDTVENLDANQRLLLREGDGAAREERLTRRLAERR
jgi:hypothetical protein